MLEYHLGVFCAELLKNRENPDALLWMMEAKKLNIPPQQRTRLNQVVQALAL